MGPKEPRDSADSYFEGTVLEATGGVYRVYLSHGVEVEASLRGRVKKTSAVGRIVPGDWVGISHEPEPGGCVIEEVRPRRNELVRATLRGRAPKVTVANVDRVLVVLSVSEPPFDRRTADRFLVLAEACEIPATLILNKVDLPEAPQVSETTLCEYGELGYPVLPTSARSGEGLGGLRSLLDRGISVLVGPSGVGKSSIMNALYPELNLRTATVGRRSGRGRHTTVGALLLPLTRKGWVADTPGFSDVSLWGVSSPRLSYAFPEFREPSERCRFRSCTHSHEPDCAVIEEVGAGRITAARYDSYLALLEERAE